MKNAMKILSLIIVMGLITFTACNEDDPAALTVVSATATGTNITTGDPITVDLNGTTAITNMPQDGVITITLSRAVKASTVSTATITLNDGAADAALTVETNGSVVTLTPNEELLGGTIYTLAISGTIAATDGGVLVAASRSFTTAGRNISVPRQDKLVVYIPFNGTVADALNHTILNNNVGFATDRLGNFEASADFNGTTNYVGVEYGADMSNANTTVSYWMKLPSSAAYAAHIGVTQFVTFAIGGNNGTYHEFGRFECCDHVFDYLKYFTNHVNSGTAGPLAGSGIEMKNEGNPSGDRVVEINNIPWLEQQTGAWVHIVTSWNAVARRKSFYINGVPSTVYELTPSAEYALDAATIDVAGITSDESNSKNLYLGSGLPYWATKTADGITPFRAEVAHAFKGQMDDFRMFSVALTDAEVLALYNAEKP